MARPKANKSEKVRNYLATNPTATAREVCKALGNKVTEGLVYQVRSKLHAVPAAKSTPEQEAPVVVKVPKVQTAKEKPVDAVTLILEVKELAAKVGGIAKLKELLDALS